MWLTVPILFQQVEDETEKIANEAFANFEEKKSQGD